MYYAVNVLLVILIPERSDGTLASQSGRTIGSGYCNINHWDNYLVVYYLEMLKFEPEGGKYKTHA